MGKLKNAMYEIQDLDEMAGLNTAIHQVHPLVKLILTVIYIGCVVSYGKYNLWGLLPFVIYPLILFYLTGISVRSCFRKLKAVLPLVFLIGIFNPLLDRQPLYKIGGIIITGGFLSMITLILKGIYALMAAFLLIATTGIERICYAMRLLHVPGILVTQILLTYRYITVLLREADGVYEAYSLRAPGEKGVRFKVWGSLLGQLLFRSIDRALNLYDSMLLRGFHGEFYYARSQKMSGKDYGFLAIWTGMFVALKLLNIGNLINYFSLLKKI
ncbi:MAG: Cobalt ECF transporter T component CbiQ [Lachnoclostridium sp.]|jgi:cobalt/nickel transport system permease protein